jgi:hypothetical protein
VFENFIAEIEADPRTADIAADVRCGLEHLYQSAGAIESVTPSRVFCGSPGAFRKKFSRYTTCSNRGLSRRFPLLHAITLRDNSRNAGDMHAASEQYGFKTLI